MYILQNEGELFPVDYPKVMHNILGKFSVLLSKGDLHRKLRSTIISFVSATKYETKFLHSMEILVLSTINSWDPNSKQVAFYKEAKRVRMPPNQFTCLFCTLLSTFLRVFYMISRISEYNSTLINICWRNNNFFSFWESVCFFL